MCGARVKADEALWPCFGDSLMQAWKLGHDSFLVRDDRSALEHLLPLAEQGFAPAQWIVGRMIAQGRGGLPRSRHDALIWLHLAEQHQLPQAHAWVARLEDGLDMAGFQTVRTRTSRWLARPHPSCRRMADITTKLGDDGSLRHHDAPQAQDWWHAMVADTIARRPEAIPYLASLHAVVFRSQGPEVSVIRYEGRPVLLVNESVMALTHAEAADIVMPAAREAVNEMAMALTGSAPLQRYRGRRLEGAVNDSSDDDDAENTAFFALARQAIDQAESLPSELRDKARTARIIRFEPAFAHAPALPAGQMGQWVPAPGGAYLAIQTPPSRLSAAALSIALVQSATLARRPPQGPVPMGVPADICPLVGDGLRTAQALEYSGEVVENLRNERAARGCPR